MINPRGHLFLARIKEMKDILPITSVLASSKYPTMKTTLESVLEFHQAFECPVATEPNLPRTPNAALLLAVAAKIQMLRNVLREHSKNDPILLRHSLELEEQAEAMQASANGDLKGLLDAYLDKRYIDEGSILTFGLQSVFSEGFERVHQSNLSKLVDGKPIKDEAGKVKKPPTYKPVDLSDLVDGTWLAAQAELEKF